MNVCRFQPLNVLGAVGTLLKRPDPYAIRALSAVVVLSEQAEAGAVVSVLFVTPGDGTIALSGNGITPVTFAFSPSDPGGGVVWIDNTTFVTDNDYAVAFNTALGSVGSVTTGIVGDTVTITTVLTGAEGELNVAPAGPGLGVTLSPVSGEAVGLDDGVLLPVVTFSFGGAGTMIKVFPALISNTAGGTYEFFFGSNVDSQSSVDPVTGNTLVSVRLPEAVGLVVNAAVEFEARSNAPVVVSDVFVSIEELLPPPQVESWDEWNEEDEE